MGRVRKWYTVLREKAHRPCVVQTSVPFTMIYVSVYGYNVTGHTLMTYPRTRAGELLDSYPLPLTRGLTKLIHRPLPPDQPPALRIHVVFTRLRQLSLADFYRRLEIMGASVCNLLRISNQVVSTVIMTLNLSLPSPLIHGLP